MYISAKAPPVVIWVGVHSVLLLLAAGQESSVVVVVWRTGRGRGVHSRDQLATSSIAGRKVNSHFIIGFNRKSYSAKMRIRWRIKGSVGSGRRTSK